MQIFLDRVGRLGKLERTPQGGYRVPARVARVGVLPYPREKVQRQAADLGIEFPQELVAQDVVRFYTPPEVLEAALPTLDDAPVTRGHPPRMVDPNNYRDVAEGTVSRGTSAFDGKYIAATLLLQGKDLLGDVEDNVRDEVSMGYYSEWHFESGVAPDGSPYDAVRDSVHYNHAAVVTAGRAGSNVCLALDSAEDLPQEEKPVKIKLKVGGSEVEVDVGELQGVVDGIEGQLLAMRSERDKLKSDLTSVQDSASEAAIEAKVTERLKAIESAKVKEGRLTELKAAYPGVAFDDLSDDAISGAYKVLEEARKADPDGLKALKGGEGATKTEDAEDSETEPALSPREAYLERQRNAWRADAQV